MRVQQWYKNFLIFIPLIFSAELLSAGTILLSVSGFILLCMISSSSYIINDIRDLETDRKHPEKSKRPLPAGQISVNAAFAVAVLLFLAAAVLGYYMNAGFLAFLIALFISNIAYTFYLKKVAIVDIHMIAGNSIIRALSGIYLLNAPMSPWFLLCVFLLALLLAASKRRSESLLLGEHKKNDRDVFKVYNEKFLDHITVILSCSLLFSYILFTVLSHTDTYLMLTIPFVSYIVFRYLYFVSENNRMSRNAELILKDRSMLSAILLWLASSVLILYVIR